MEIKKLDREIYASQRFTARYQTNGYYAIGAGFRMASKSFDAPVEHLDGNTIPES